MRISEFLRHTVAEVEVTIPSNPNDEWFTLDLSRMSAEDPRIRWRESDIVIYLDEQTLAWIVDEGQKALDLHNHERDCHGCGKRVAEEEIVWALEDGTLSVDEGLPWCVKCVPNQPEG